MNYKGINNTVSQKLFRSVGVNESGGQIGFGFQHKPGIINDETNSTFYYYSMVYVIRGKGCYIDADNNTYELVPGSIFQRFPGIPHTTVLEPNSNWAECYMDFGIEIYNFLVSMRIINRSIPVFKLSENRVIEETIFDHLNFLKICKESELPNFLIKNISFLQTLTYQSKLKNESEVDKNIIDKSCSDFTKDFKKRINLKSYCYNNALGYESFRKVFRDTIGISPGKYIIRRRIDVACQELVSTNKTIGEISDDLGYKSQYEFSAQFKKVTGVSPYNFKKNS